MRYCLKSNHIRNHRHKGQSTWQRVCLSTNERILCDVIHTAVRYLLQQLYQTLQIYCLFLYEWYNADSSKNDFGFQEFNLEIINLPKVVVHLWIPTGQSFIQICKIVFLGVQLHFTSDHRRLEMFKLHKSLAFCLIFVALSLIIHILTFSNLQLLFYTLHPKAEVLQSNQTMILDVQTDNDTAGLQLYRAGLPWDIGTMELTLSSATVYNTLPQTGIIDRSDPTWQNLQKALDAQSAVLAINIHLRNISARHDLTPQPDMIIDTEQPPYRFLINFLDLDWKDDIHPNVKKITDPYFEQFDPEPVYFSGHPIYTDKDQQIRRHFEFELLPGHEADYTLLYVGTREALTDAGRVLKAGVTPNKKYAVCLTPSTGDEP